MKDMIHNPAHCDADQPTQLLAQASWLATALCETFKEQEKVAEEQDELPEIDFCEVYREMCNFEKMTKLERKRLEEKRGYEFFKSKGICVKCRAEDALPPHSYCAACLVRISESRYGNSYRRRRWAE